MGLIDTEEAVKAISDILAEVVQSVTNAPKDAPKTAPAEEVSYLVDQSLMVLTVLALGVKLIEAWGLGLELLRRSIERLRRTPSIGVEVIVSLPRVGLRRLHLGCRQDLAGVRALRRQREGGSVEAF
jgi:hypothetical protein